MHVDGASWGGKPFPSLEDVPVEIQVEDVNVRVRDAAAKVFPTKQVVEHTRSYFGPFVDALTKCLGDPPAITAIDVADWRSGCIAWLEERVGAAP